MSSDISSNQKPLANKYGGPQGADLTGQVVKLFQDTIGTGASTDVFKGEWRPSIDCIPIMVAIKIFRCIHNTSGIICLDDITRRLVRESRAWYRLDHPNIQPYLGHCADLGPSIALISPYWKQGCVRSYLQRHPDTNKSIRMKILKDVSEGLHYLHDNKIIHGDLQQNNVLIDDQGNGRLADFGRAKVIDHEGYNTDMLAGSVAYMAPELVPLEESDINVDGLFSHKSDIYAFGMLAFELFTDTAPYASYRAVKDYQIVPLVHGGFRPKRGQDRRRYISDDMWALMQICWAHEPKQRPTAKYVLQQLRLY